MRNYAYACVRVEKRMRMRKMTRVDAFSGVNGARAPALREITHANAANPAASKVEHGPTFLRVRTRKACETSAVR